MRAATAGGAMSARALAAELSHAGYRFASGVPCGVLARLIDACGEPPMRYVPAAHEGTALAMAIGAELGGQRAVVLLQNSGLGNLMNPLASLAVPYRVPVLLVVSLRGWPDPETDEPQHRIMGGSTQTMLDACGVEHRVLEPGESPAGTVEAVARAREERRPYALLVPRGAFKREDAASGGTDRVSAWNRRALVAELSRQAGGEDGPVILGGTGYLSRELFESMHRPRNFYLQGAMGHLSSVALGLALSRPGRDIIVLDGDGAALMHLGSMATVGGADGADLVHIVVENGAYESTGGQPLGPTTIPWERLATTLGYDWARRCEDEEGFRDALREALAEDGTRLIVARVGKTPGRAPARPSHSHGLDRLARDFAEAVGQGDRR